MVKRLNTLEQVLAFAGPWLKNKLGQQSLYWSFLDVTTACNMRCGYCSVIESKGSSIDMPTAQQAIDFLHDHGGRVVALMGGEPSLLRESLTEIVEYATKKRMFTYLPTNISLLDESFSEDLVNAGIGVIDVAIDSVDKKPGFDKNLEQYRGNFDRVLQTRRHGVYIKLNTVITTKNVDDVYELVELAKREKIPISLHLIEGAMPGTQQKDYKWLHHDWHFKPEDYPAIEKLSDWLIEKKREGYWIMNPAWYFERIKEMVEYGEHSGWRCTAGQHTLFIDERGSFSPCVSLKWQEDKKWGNLEEGVWPLDEGEMKRQLEVCNRKCLSCANTLTTKGEENLYNFLKPYVYTRAMHLLGKF